MKNELKRRKRCRDLLATCSFDTEFSFDFVLIVEYLRSQCRLVNVHVHRFRNFYPVVRQNRLLANNYDTTSETLLPKALGADSSRRSAADDNHGFHRC